MSSSVINYRLVHSPEENDLIDREARENITRAVRPRIVPLDADDLKRLKKR